MTELLDRAAAAALVALAEHGKTTDLQEALVYGVPGFVPPAAIRAMVAAVIETLIDPTPAMEEAFVNLALRVQIGGDVSWRDYARAQWTGMLRAGVEGAVA